MERYQSGNKRYHSIETVSLLVTAHLNLSKAFASICPSILLNKLQALRTSTNALRTTNALQEGNKLLALEYQYPCGYLNMNTYKTVCLLLTILNTQNTEHYLRMFVTTREPCIKTLEVLMVRTKEGR